MATAATAHIPDIAAPGRSRLSELAALIERFEAFHEESPRPEFTTLFGEAAMALELTDAQLARKFRISRPTVGRWIRGESAPHSLGRKSVFNVLMRDAKEKVRAIESRSNALRGRSVPARSREFV